jgi:hypothetical protein
LRNAPKTDDGQPNRSEADFFFCLYGIEHGGTEAEAAANLIAVSDKAKEEAALKNGKYASRTAAAAAHVARRRRGALALKP